MGRAGRDTANELWARRVAGLWQHGAMNDDQTLPTRTTLPAADRRRLVRAATRLLGPFEAEDAVQDAYLRVLEADDGDAAPVLNSTQAWLLTMVRNLAIDRLRRRNWMDQWLGEETAVSADAGGALMAAPSAESDAALAEEVAQALRLLAAHLAPEDGAAVLLHEVFEASHADIAHASGRSEARSRQHLRRALQRLRLAGGTTPGPDAERDPAEETVLRLYLQSLQLRDPQTLWAMLRHPPITAMVPVSAGHAAPTGTPAAAPQAVLSGIVQMGGQLGLVLTLDGVALCVVPLGPLADAHALAA